MLNGKLTPFIRNPKKDLFIRCDNANENFKYTISSTPQQNGCAERKFQTLYGHVRAMNHGLGLPVPIRKQLWPGCVNTVTNLYRILVREGQELCTFQKFSGKDKESIVDGSKKFSQHIVRSDRTQIKANLKDRGQAMYCMSYDKNHLKKHH